MNKRGTFSKYKQCLRKRNAQNTWKCSGVA